MAYVGTHGLCFDKCTMVMTSSVVSVVKLHIKLFFDSYSLTSNDPCKKCTTLMQRGSGSIVLDTVM